MQIEKVQYTAKAHTSTDLLSRLCVAIIFATMSSGSCFKHEVHK